MTSKKVRTRIAPSPTGSPHIGTAYSALFNYCFAKKNNGDFILRIEDTDRGRYVEGSEEEIFQALKWIGLEPDEAPGKEGSFGPYRQSERLEIYKKHLETLIKEGKAYYCDCTPERLETLRKEQQARGEIPHYDRKCRTNPPKDTSGTVVVRLAIPEDGETIVEDKIRGKVIFQNKVLDDQVLLKSDGFPTYHLASVVDDHLMEITHVIRAEEWLSSTPKHVLLYQAFGWELPAFAHLPLLRNADKSKISKRKNPVSIDFYRQEGYLPEALVNFLGLMGWSMPEDKEIFSLEEMIKEFSFDRISPSGPIFDLEKLGWLNGEYIRSLTDEDLTKRLEGFTKYNLDARKKAIPLVKNRLKKLSEFDNLVFYFFEDLPSVDKKLVIINGDEAKTFETYKKVKDALEAVSSWKKDTILETLEKIRTSLELGRGDLYQSIRAALTGSKASPPLDETIETLGKEKTLTRINKILEAFGSTS